MKSFFCSKHAWVFAGSYPAFRDNPSEIQITIFDLGPNGKGDFPETQYVYLGPVLFPIDFEPKQCDTQALSSIDKAINKLDEKHAEQRHELWQKKQELLSLTYSGDSDEA